jgi:hypothetical protein
MRIGISSFATILVFPVSITRWASAACGTTCFTSSANIPLRRLVKPRSLPSCRAFGAKIHSSGLFTVALQFQVGLRISPFAPAVAHQIDPARFVRHIARGTRMKRDISADWNFRDDYHKPIDEVRSELGVTPLD